MRKLLCHVCGNPADRNEQGVLWLLDNTTENCPPSWPEEEITVHPPLCLGCAAKAIEQCPELYKKGFTAIRVRDPQPYGYLGRLYARDPSMPHSPFPILAKEREIVAFEDPRLPWLQAAQSAMCLVGCTVVDLNAELAAEGARTRCPHEPACPADTAADREAAVVVWRCYEQGWALLCNGVFQFDDTGELLPDGQVIAPHRTLPTIPATSAA